MGNGWDAGTGFRITSGKMPVLYEILDDDEDFLYVRGNPGILKISKKLDGTFVLLDENSELALYKKLEEEEYARALPAGENAAESVTEREDALYFQGQKLLSLAPYREEIEKYFQLNPGKRNETGMTYDARLMKLDDELSLLQVTVHYMLHIPAPYTPYEVHLFVLRQNQIRKIEGFSQYPRQLFRNPDGSYWLAKPAILPEDVTARNYDEARGTAALIRPDGSSVLINGQLGTWDVDLLHVNEQGTAVFKAFDRGSAESSAGKDGIYTVDTSLNTQKVTDTFRGAMYVDKSGQIFTLQYETHTIINITAK